MLICYNNSSLEDVVAVIILNPKCSACCNSNDVLCEEADESIVMQAMCSSGKSGNHQLSQEGVLGTIYKEARESSYRSGH